MALSKADKDELKDIIASIKPEVPDCSEDIQAIIRVQATQTEQMSTMIKSMEKLQLTVYGNGKPGLVTIVSGLVSQAGFVKWVGGAFGLMTIALIWAIITHTVEIVSK